MRNDVWVTGKGTLLCILMAILAIEIAIVIHRVRVDRYYAWSRFHAPYVDFYAIVKKFNDILRFLTDSEDRQIPNL
jgi:hypothetical protein